MKKLMIMMGVALASVNASLAADETIVDDTSLSADKTVSGTLYIGNCATVDLNGYNLTVDGIVRADTEDVVGYKFLDYVQSDGNQWMNTGYTANWDDRVELKVLFTRFNADDWQSVFCARDTSYNNAYSMFARKTAFRFDHGSNKHIDAAVDVNTEYSVVINGKTGAVTVNDWSTTTYNASFTTGSPFSLLAGHAAGSSLSPASSVSMLASCRLYYFRVYDASGAVQLDLIPAVRTSDGAVGMYDRKNGGFVENLGSKAFVAGPRAAVTIANSADTVSELRVNVADGVIATNEAVSINGNVKFIKDGGGTFFQKKTGQTYSAGTQVIDGKIAFNGKGASGLLGGARYKELDFIQSNGNQWLYSAYTPEYTDKIVMNVNFTRMVTGTDWIGLFCSRGTGSAYPYMVAIQGGTTFRVDHINSGAMSVQDYVEFTFETGVDYTVSIDGKTRSWSVNENSGNWTESVSSNWNATGPFSILGCHTEGANLASKKGSNISLLPSCKLYGFQVYGGDGNLKCDMIPAIRPVDGAVGMYDRARNIFIENYGSVAFTPGPVRNAVFSDVEVESGATLEFAEGARDFCDYPIVLNGGRLKNSSNAGTNAALVASLRLTADSVWEHTRDGGMLGRNGADTTIDLGGYTLTVDSENSQSLYFKNTTIINGGSIIIPEHLWFETAGEGVIATSADFDMSGLALLNAPLSVRNYTIRRDQTSPTTRDAAKLIVHGRLSPVGARSGVSCTIMDGSTIDLSRATARLTAATTGGIQFEDNSTITVTLGSSQIRNPLVAWAVAPDNIDTVKFVRGEGTPELAVRGDGLYAVRGLVISFR